MILKTLKTFFFFFLLSPSSLSDSTCILEVGWGVMKLFPRTSTSRIKKKTNQNSILPLVVFSCTVVKKKRDLETKSGIQILFSAPRLLSEEEIQDSRHQQQQKNESTALSILKKKKKHQILENKCNNGFTSTCVNVYLFFFPILALIRNKQEKKRTAHTHARSSATRPTLATSDVNAEVGTRHN